MVSLLGLALSLAEYVSILLIKIQSNLFPQTPLNFAHKRFIRYCISTTNQAVFFDSGVNIPVTHNLCVENTPRHSPCAVKSSWQNMYLLDPKQLLTTILFPATYGLRIVPPFAQAYSTLGRIPSITRWHCSI